ncbi:MAG: arginine repressor [Gammaproteobacteria bacterium]|jgi:transcriptional regulator of arginine metabolism
MPTDPSLQTARRAEILRILKQESITRQEDLVKALASRGMDATQASISRDLKELGVAKVGDRYIAPQNVRSQGNVKFELLAGFVTGVAPAGANLTVIKTSTGAAQSVAVALDESAWSEIVGTISGDDTIFVATAGVRQQQSLMVRLAQVFPKARQS